MAPGAFVLALKYLSYIALWRSFKANEDPTYYQHLCALIVFRTAHNILFDTVKIQFKTCHFYSCFHFNCTMHMTNISQCFISQGPVHHALVVCSVDNVIQWINVYG